MTIAEIYIHYGLSPGASGFGPRWGTFHWGLDFPTPIGVPIHTHIDCRLPLSGFYDDNGDGKREAGYIVLEALDGSHHWTLAHISEASFAPGTVVKAGAQVGKTGNSGNSTGAHLHCEYSKGRFRGSISASHQTGVTIDPLPIIETLIGGRNVTKLESFRRAFITQANRWPNDDETTAWQKSGMEDYAWIQLNGYFPMKEERDQKIRELAEYRTKADGELTVLSNALIQKNETLANLEADFEQERTGWKQTEDGYLADRERREQEHLSAIEALKVEIADLEALLANAQQNAKDPARWSWEQHLSAAFRKFFKN